MYRTFRKRDNIISRDINSTRPYISYLALVKEISYNNHNPVSEDIEVDCGSDGDSDDYYWEELYIGPENTKEAKPSKEEDVTPPRKNFQEERKDKWYSAQISNLDYVQFSIGLSLIILPLYIFLKEREKFKKVNFFL